FSIHLLCFNYLNILRFFLSEPAAKRNHLDCLQDDNIFINTIKKHINLYIARIEQGRMPCLARPVKTKNLFMKKYFFLCAATASLAVFACNSQPKQSEQGTGETQADSSSVKLADQDAFSDTLNGKMVSIFYLRNQDIEASVTNYGGRIVNLFVPDQNNNMTDVIIGPGNYKDMYETKDFFGAIIGR